MMKTWRCLLLAASLVTAAQCDLIDDLISTEAEESCARNTPDYAVRRLKASHITTAFYAGGEDCLSHFISAFNLSTLQGWTDGRSLICIYISLPPLFSPFSYLFFFFFFFSLIPSELSECVNTTTHADGTPYWTPLQLQLSAESHNITSGKESWGLGCGFGHVSCRANRNRLREHLLDLGDDVVEGITADEDDRWGDCSPLCIDFNNPDIDPYRPTLVECQDGELARFRSMDGPGQFCLPVCVGICVCLSGVCRRQTVFVN